MAHLRRPSYTRPIPTDAEIITRTVKGQDRRFARFKRKGKPAEAPLTADGQRIRLYSRKFVGEYRDKDGTVHPVTLCTDKTASEQMLAELVKRAEFARVGIADPFEAHHKRPLTEHLDDYRRYLLAEGNGLEYVSATYARIRAILDGCRFVFSADLTPERVAEFLHGLRRDPPRPELPAGQEWFTPPELIAALGGVRPTRLARLLRREGLVTTGNGKARRYPRATVEALQDRLCRGIGLSTSNGYLTAIKCFSRWLFEKERIDRDRLISLSRLNAKTDPRHERRALPEGKLRSILIAAGDSAADFQGLTGPDRLLLYATAMVTGFRAAELASLYPASFELNTDAPTVTVKAAYSKNRRQSVQPLPPDVASALREYLGKRPAGLPVWPGSWHKDAAEMLRVDLAAAGISYRDGEGRVADFHSLRHSYITLLERSGVSPKLAQELARHSDIRLTMNVYTHARLHDLAGAVEGLPAMLPTGPETLAATGTDGHLSSNCLPFSCAPGEKTCVSVTTPDNADTESSIRTGCQNTAENTAFEKDCERMTTPERNLPGQDSNLDKENQNLLCYRYTTG